MIKIYLLNTTSTTVENKLQLQELRQYLVNKSEKTTCYSQENGIFIEEKGVISYIEPNFDEKYEEVKYLSNTLIVQYSSPTKITVLSQLPLNYILHKCTIFEYKLHVKSMLKLIIVTININDNYKVLDFYFECSKNDFNIENLFFQEEINRFLSVVN